jgi:hypothetical protein
MRAVAMQHRFTFPYLVKIMKNFRIMDAKPSRYSLPFTAAIFVHIDRRS